MSSNLVRRPAAIRAIVRAIVSAIVVVLAVGACGSAGEDADAGVTAPSTSAPPTTAPATTVPTTVAPTSVPQELTAEEQLRVNPPPPQRVSAARQGAAVTLTWSPPPPVTVPHTYSDTVVEYRIYRSVGASAEVLVGTSQTLTFTDLEPGAGTLRYFVSSVREHGVEGPRTDVVVPAP
jgi:hypothetical protein